MPLPAPFFLINFKVYRGTAGRTGLEFADTVERVAGRSNSAFAVAPQTTDLRLFATETSLPVIAQAVDPVAPGRGTGRVLAEAVAETGAVGTLLNHAEQPIHHDDVARALKRCRSAGLAAIVCVDSLDAGRAVATLDPDWLLFEKPADIATDRAITRTHPDRVEAFIDMVEEVNPRSKVLLGGGISTVADVERAFELGADAAGAASAAIEADDPEAWLESIAKAVPYSE